MRGKNGATNGIADKQFAGCFVTSFCARTSPNVSQASSKANSKSNFVDQNGLPKCKMLIMGDFTHSSQRKEQYLSSIKWQKLPADYAPKLYSEKHPDHQLIMHDISSCDPNSFNVVLRSSTYITIVPSSARDLSLCCHAVFDKDQLLSDECKVVYLNLVEPNSPEYLDIENEAKKWINKKFNLSPVEAASILSLIETAVGHTKTVAERLLDSNRKGI